MIAAVSIGVGAPQLVSSRPQDGAKTGRGRRQDKRTGTFQVHVVDGVENFPGPRVQSRVHSDNFFYEDNGLSGTLRVEPRYGG